MLLRYIYEEGLANSPDKPVLIIDDSICTYRELHEVSERWAEALLRCGVTRGDRITLLMGNRIEYLQFYFACYRIGAIASPMSTVYQTVTAEIAFATNLTKSKLLIASDEFLAVVGGLKDRVPSLERIFSIDDGGDENLSWKAFAQRESGQVEWPEVKESDPALIIFTSGSTDRPKGVTHTHHSLLQGAINKSITLGLGSRHSFLISTVLCHASGGFGFSLPVILRGGTAIFMGKFNATGFLEMIRRHRPTHIAALPVEAREIISDPSATRNDFRSIEGFHCGGDTVTSDILDGFHELAGFEMNQSYGCTECEEFCINPPYGKMKRGSIGIPAFNTKIRLIDSVGHDVRLGETGEILVQSEATMAGYWDDPVNTAKAFIDGWLRTGDLAREDEEGYYYFVGRIKNIIIKGYGNIAPGEVEDAINAHPRVKVSGVVGSPDKILGEIVHAFVVVAKDADGRRPTVEELREFVGQRLSAFKVPDRWTFVDSLPVTTLGKIDRKAIAETARTGACAGERKA
jgi:long-chain acyl-CoA synthetase